MTESAASNPDSRATSNPWLVLVLLLLIYTFSYADRYLIAGLVEPIKAEFGVGDQFIGLLMGPAFIIFYVVMGIPIARLADRSSRIAIICAGCVLWSVFTGLSGFATSATMLAIARVGVGVGEAAFAAPAYALLSDYFRPEKRALAFAVLGVAVYAGQIAGYKVGPEIAADYGWRNAFYVMAIIGIILGVVAWVVVREPARTVQKAAGEPFAPLVRRLAAAPSYLLMMVAMGLGTMSGISFGFWGPALFARNYGLSMEAASGIFGLYFGIAGLTGMILFGALANRVARNYSHGPLLLGAGALLSATVCILAVTWSPNLGWAKFFAIPSGLLGGGWSVGVMVTLQYLLPDRFRATATATFLAVSTLIGFLVGPWLAGAVSEALGNNAASLKAGLSVVIPVGFVGAIAALIAVRRLERDRGALAG